ncbi:hypothetical protein M406DRAFT_102705 [Cryphonectria parasitica EP155]|uniref:F-box domain-containing protein n=1 Tax=Cryphonectria parasitica (strain ATCC 38755 / EP155) TaxID=660469 RepID=A0A9P5CSB5_CRYP1|nr:uncharacterized protein M406DRAFT_102705 [Cryphonectria parasitica EP155]KAF3768407.1 hypothetical protein M406DRAFT_102705 [Cryphonectria parasitica EP155]
MFKQLPPELRLAILLHLEIFDRLCFYLTCRDNWDLHLMDQNFDEHFFKIKCKRHELWKRTMDLTWKPYCTDPYMDFLRRLERDAHGSSYICSGCFALHSHQHSTFEEVCSHATNGFGEFLTRQVGDKPFEKKKVTCALTGSSPWERKPIVIKHQSLNPSVLLKVDFHCNYNSDEIQPASVVHRIVRMLLPPSVVAYITNAERSVTFPMMNCAPFRLCSHFDFQRFTRSSTIPESDSPNLEPILDGCGYFSFVRSKEILRTGLYTCDRCGSAFSFTFHNLGSEIGIEFVFDAWNSGISWDARHGDGGWNFLPWDSWNSEGSDEEPAQLELYGADELPSHDMEFIYASALVIPGSSARHDSSLAQAMKNQ